MTFDAEAAAAGNAGSPYLWFDIDLEDVPDYPAIWKPHSLGGLLAWTGRRSTAWSAPTPDGTRRATRRPPTVPREPPGLRSARP